MIEQCAVVGQIPVKLRAEKKNGKIDFKHEWKGPNGSWKGGDIVLDPDSGAHEIVFELDPHSPKKLRFMNDPSDAIWISVSSGCPTAKCNEGGQITPVSVSEDGTRLTVRNENSGDPIDLHYVLRFKRDWPFGKRPEYDPIIRNGGGGTFS